MSYTSYGDYMNADIQQVITEFNGKLYMNDTSGIMETHVQESGKWRKMTWDEHSVFNLASIRGQTKEISRS